MTRVKICGCMRPEDAVAAAMAGADFVGIVFAEGVRRQVSAEDGEAIAAAVREAIPTAATPLVEPGPPVPADPRGGWFQRWAGEIERRLSLRRPLLVGVFVNQPSEFINEIVEECGLDLVQLSGDEPWEAALGIIRPVLKMIKVEPGQTAGDVLSGLQSGLAALPLLEPLVEGAPGGTGTRLDWDLARQVAAQVPMFLSGGLTPENVGQAIRQVRPWGVDVSSGVETGGQKDPTKIRAFVAAVHAAIAPEDTQVL